MCPAKELPKDHVLCIAILTEFIIDLYKDLVLDLKKKKKVEIVCTFNQRLTLAGSEISCLGMNSLVW